MGAGLFQPAHQEATARCREETAVESVDLGEADIGIGDALRVHGTVGDAFEAQVAMGQFEAALFIERHHGEDAVHADGGARRQPFAQHLQALMPQRGAQLAAAQVGADDEQAHEAELAAMGKDAAAAHHLVTLAQGDEGVGIDCMGDGKVGQTGVPSFRRRPLFQGLNLVGAHGGDGKRGQGHGLILVSTAPPGGRIRPPPDRKAVS